MSLFDAPVDWRGRSLGLFQSDRDIPACLAWWDASTLAGANASAVKTLGDQSGAGMGLSASGTARPTLNAPGLNGKNTITLSTIQCMQSTLGITNWNARTLAQPFTHIALVKMRAAGTSASARSIFSSSGGAVGMAIIAKVTSSSGYDQWLYPTAGSAGVGGGPGLADDTWHVVITRMNSQGYTTMVDGQVTQAAVSALQGSASLSGRLLLGAYNTSLAFPMDGDFAEGGIFAGELSLKACERITDYLRAKWNYGPTTTPVQNTVHIRDALDSNSQTLRIMASSGISAQPPLVIFNHQQGGNSSLQPGLAGYPLVHALVNSGYVVVLHNNHGTDSWTNTNAINDGPLAESTAATVLGLGSGFSRVIILGQSMGGMLAVMQAQLAAFTAPVKGVAVIDAALNLKWVYESSGYKASVDTAFSIVTGTLAAGPAAGATSVSSSVSFPNGTAIVIDPNGTNPEYRTTNGAPTGAGPYTIPVPALTFAHSSAVAISDMPAKTVGRDPCKLVSGGIVTGLRWRAYASANDPTVAKTQNIDVFQPIVAGDTPAETFTVKTHPGGHLEVSAYDPIDVVAFADRCV